MFGWMYWSWQSMLFIGGIILAVLILGIMGVRKPDYGRKGFFPIETTRGDRLFIGIITSLSFMILWIAFVGNVLLLIPFLLVCIWFAIQMKWG